MFTKIGVTLASGTLPVLLWAGAAGAQTDPVDTTVPPVDTTVPPVVTTLTPTTQSQTPTSRSQSQFQSQSQSQSTIQQSPTNPQTTNTGGTLARTGAEDVLPLAAGGVVLAGAVAYFGLRRRSVS